MKQYHITKWRGSIVLMSFASIVYTLNPKKYIYILYHRSISRLGNTIVFFSLYKKLEPVLLLFDYISIVCYEIVTPLYCFI